MNELACGLLIVFFIGSLSGLTIVFVSRRTLDENYGTLDYTYTIFLRISRYVWRGFKGRF
jgi:hypothetical protein